MVGRWAGSTVLVAASGPSLCAADLALFQGLCPVVVINNTFRLAPWADVLYACDYKWWAHYHLEVESGFHGERWTCSPRARIEFGLRWIEGRSGTGYDAGTDFIRHGSNSGMQGVCLAAKLGATRVILLGFDHQRAPDGTKHWHPDHGPARLNTTPDWPAHVAGMHLAVEQLAAVGVQVLNASRETALEIPRISVEAARGLFPQTDRCSS